LFQAINIQFIGGDGGSTSGFIYEDSPHVHVEHRALKGSGKSISTRGVVVELGKRGFENLESNHAIEAVIYPELFVGRELVLGPEKVGADRFHSQALL